MTVLKLHAWLKSFCNVLLRGHFNLVFDVESITSSWFFFNISLKEYLYIHRKCGLSQFVQICCVLQTVSGDQEWIKTYNSRIHYIITIFLVARTINFQHYCWVRIALDFHINEPWTKSIYIGYLWAQPICHDLLCFTESCCALLPPNTSGAQELASGQHLQFTNAGCIQNLC